MAKSLLEQLPGIVAAGKKQAQQILEQLEGPQRVSLQTRELVIPNRATSGFDLSDPATADLKTPVSRLIYGDNLLAMAALLAGDEASDTESLRDKVNLIYIDPPFDSKADYRTKLQLPGTDVEQRPTTAEQFAYSDTWAEGTASYLAMIAPRLMLMRELLADTGSIYVHLDWHVGHYVKIVLDEIFGKQNLINEIIWHYPDKLQGNIRGLPNNHDAIYVYSKSEQFEWNGVKIPLDKARKINRRLWNPATQKLDTARDDAGRVIYDSYSSKNADDVWQIPQAEVTKNPNKTGYGTEKPETILRRIIEASTNPGDLVADFFTGSGTTAAVAEMLGRRWIATDLGKPAVMITRKRLIDNEATPFLYQAIGDYQVEQARSTLGRKYRSGDLAQTVLGIYGALPLPTDQSLGGILGYLPGESTLVYADSPSRQVVPSTLKRARQLRETAMGGFEKVIVLGWNFGPGIGQQIAALNDDKLEVRVIPPDLLDQLKKKGASGLAGKITFSTLQYLRATVTNRFQGVETEEIVVRLEDYVLLSPEAISIREEDRHLIRELANREPLALVEYWAVDPDYDGLVFRSVWQNYRGNVLDDGDPLRVSTVATVTTSRRDGPRAVCVRAVDVFGFESEVVIELSGGNP